MHKSEMELEKREIGVPEKENEDGKRMLKCGTEKTLLEFLLVCCSYEKFTKVFIDTHI